MVESATIQTLDESQIDATLDREIRRFLVETFPNWADIFRTRRAWHDARPVRTVLATVPLPAPLSGSSPGVSSATSESSESSESPKSPESPKSNGVDFRVVGHVAVVERTVTTCWNWRYAVAGVQGVSVAPDFRKTGLSTRLLDVALAESTALGYPFAVLFCREPLVPFYERNGWSLPNDSMIMWKDRELPIHMQSNCPMYRELSDETFPEGPIDVHNPF
ncbi:MAG: GNAT family N-acetyltransferase [Thermoguttaceae bacterium]|nr:GNAT family N-acetyltransferase [Thermoguttaceae bacterium]